MKVNGLTMVSTQKSHIPAANHTHDAMACLKCETENNDICTPGMIILMRGKLFYHPTAAV